jgi:hypothetical protein
MEALEREVEMEDQDIKGLVEQFEGRRRVWEGIVRARGEEEGEMEMEGPKF